MTKRVHIAIAVRDLSESIKDYSKRLEVAPTCVIKNKYALFRTELINLSITENIKEAGQLRHLGFEDDQVLEFSEEEDINGIKWEKFNQKLQEDEIVKYYLSKKS